MRDKDWTWDEFFIGMAKYVSTASKDPSTQVGAVLVDSDRRVIGMGYNGFPRGVHDDVSRYLDKPTKYAMVVHAELNAILNAHAPTEGSTLYVWPQFYTAMPPVCNECAKAVIQAGITRVVGNKVGVRGDFNIGQMWAKPIEDAKTMLIEAQVEMSYV